MAPPAPPPSPPRRSPRRELSPSAANSMAGTASAGGGGGLASGGGGSSRSTPTPGKKAKGGKAARTPAAAGTSVLEHLPGSPTSPRPPSSAGKRRGGAPSSSGKKLSVNTAAAAAAAGATANADNNPNRRSSPRRRRGVPSTPVAAAAAPMDVHAKEDTARSAEKVAADDADSEEDEKVKVVEPKPKDESKKKRQQKKSSVAIAKHAETNADEQQQKQQEVESSQPKVPERRTTRSRAAKRDHDGPTQDGDDQMTATRKDKAKTDKAPRAKKQKTASAPTASASASTGSGNAKNRSRKNSKSFPTPQQQTKAAKMREATERLLSRTRYEIEVDPYRGIYDGRYGFDPPNPLQPIDRRAGFGNGSNDDNNNVGGDDDDDDDDDDVMAVDDMPKPPPPTNPWGGCGGCCTEVGGPNGTGPNASSQLDVMRLNPMNADDFLGGQAESDEEEDGGSAESQSKVERVIAAAIAAREEDANLNGNDTVQEVKIPLVPECLCESRNKWANESADIEMKRVKKARDKKASKEKGRRSGGSSSASTRSLKRQRSNMSVASTTVGGTSDDDDVVVVVDEDSKTNDKDEMEGAEDGQVGEDADTSNKIQVSVMPVRRNPDPSFRCPCDYNPLCLSSLGGAIDDLIHHKALEKAREELYRAADVCGDAVVEAEYTGAGPGKAAGMGATTTAQEDGIARLRKSLPIEIESIRRHLTEVVRPYATDDEGLQLTQRSIDQCIDMIQETHKGLIYEEMIDAASSASLQDQSEDDDTSSCIRLSTPPGLRNLGATCYLNSQFQCLAQNPAFVDGVFSWIGGGVGGSAGGSRMDQVLLTMQTLLAEMNHGAENVVCTEPFGNALGLEHGEMQDPNEFARLLFDRMHESFQKSALAVAAATNGGSGPSSEGECSATALAELLPNLFRGICTYETKCEECNTKSARSENFMELTLPLVKPGDFRIKDSSLSRSAMPSQDASSAATDTKSRSKKGKKKGRGRKSSKGSATDSSSEENDASSKANPQDSRDVTVQGCLDAYLYPEMLEDDNRFYCTNCAKKVDAVRSVSLSQLPPVLNILIARYVFDRLTFMKKKLSDRVLLPRTLRIPKKCTDPTEDEDDEEDSTEDAIYVLCAIQNHRGASAYGGHYVAEAMDWTTGVWYDYNDEEVTLLPSGPNCSYVPAAFSTTSSPIPPPIAAAGGGKIKKIPPLRGSSDAYSLFYVERSFLAKTSSKLILRGSISSLSAMEANTIAKMAQQRQERYQEMTDLTLEKQRTSDRLERRRREIEKQLFSAFSNAKSSRPPVWVDGKVLLQYLSCLDGMDAILQRHPLLQHRDLICSHGQGGLHPRVARSGKLLPRHIYDTVVSLLSDEKDQLALKSSGEEAKPSAKRGKRRSVGGRDKSDEAADLIIAPDSSLFCSECVETYRKELAAKERALSLVLSLHEDFDGKRNDLDPKSLPEGQDIFAVSRHFVTVFKKHAERVMKEASSPRVVCKGIDLLDLSFLPSFHTKKEAKMEESVLSSASDCMIIEKEDSIADTAPPVGEALDLKINGKISCEHGRSNVLKYKKSVRYVPAEVWAKLVQLFPEAIPFRRFRRRSDDDDDSEVEDLCNDEVFDGKCIDCEMEKAGSSEMLEKLQEWGQNVLSSPYLIPPKMAGQKTREITLQELYSFYSSPEKLIRKNANITCLSFHIVHRENIQAWRSAVDILQALSRSKKKSKAAGDEAKEKIIALAPWTMKSILCEHNCVPLIKPDIDKLVLGALCGSIKISNLYNKELLRQIEIMSSDEYSAYIESLKGLRSIISPRGQTENGEAQDILSGAGLKSYHPCFQFGVENFGKPKTPQGQSPRPLPHRGVSPRPSPPHGQLPRPSPPQGRPMSSLPVPARGQSPYSSVPRTSPSPASKVAAALPTSASKITSSLPSSASKATADAPTVWVKSTPEPCKCNECLDGFVAAALALSPSPMKPSAQNVEVVDPPDDGQVDIKVHELDGGVELDAALSVLSAEINSASTIDGVEDGGTGTRRSTRKRKTRTDGITTHEFRLFPQDNLAKLKLLLLERANKKLFNQEWRLVSSRSDRNSPPPPSSEGEPTPPSTNTAHFLSTTELGNDEKPLCDYFVDTKKAGNDDTDALDAEEQCRQEKTLHLILQYRDEDGGVGTDGNGRKSRRLTAEEKEERQKAEDSLMAALTDMANVPDIREAVAGADQGTRNRPRRRRREERGFRGTFLHGLSPPPSAEEGTFTPKEFSPGASPKAVMTECIILDDSPTEKQQSQPPQPQPRPETKPQSSSPHPPTAIDASNNAPSMKKQRLTPPLQDANDVIIIDDEDDAVSRSESQRSGDLANEAMAAPNKNNVSNGDLLRLMDQDLPSSNSSAVDEKTYNQQFGVYDLSKEALHFTAPIYAPSAPEIIDEEETHLCCGLASIDRDNVMEFVSAMRKKPSSFWQNKDIEFEAMKAFRFHLPKSVPAKHARHLYRNFADIPPKNWSWSCACKQGKPLPISRRELDIMLYFISKDLRTRDCHEFMPYRNERDLRHVFDTVKKCHRDGVFDELYMNNALVGVQRIVSAEQIKQDETS